MATTSGATRQDLAEIAARIDKHLVQEATELIEGLTRRLDREELLLISPDLRQQIDRLLPKRRKQLSSMLDETLSKPRVQVYTPQSGVKPPLKQAIADRDRLQKYKFLLVELAGHHIFQWATFYRDSVGFIFKDVLASQKSADSWSGEIESLSAEFTKHATEIFGRGHARLASSGFSEDVSEVKSINGLLRFLYLIINLFLDAREATKSAKEARLLRDLTSSLIIAILRGYGRVHFGSHKGWDFLAANPRNWVAALGFTTGRDTSPLLDEFEGLPNIRGIQKAVVPVLMAIEQIINKHQGSSFVLPRLSRIPVADPAQLEITLTASGSRARSDIVISAFFEGVISDRRILDDALGMRANVVIATLSGQIRAWLSGNPDQRIVDTADDAANHSHNVAQLIRGQIEASESQDDAREQSLLIQRNYAREFPLEDPEFRRLFLVERHSVKNLLEHLDQGTGIHLWCSVRRSGKTTAISNLADATGRSTVVIQTMDHQPNQLELNILETRVRDALQRRIAIGQNFFEKIVEEAILSLVSIQAERRKVVFVIDEYESLFGLLDAFTRNDQDLRYLVVQPLLSQMVGFSARNLLILMGQRPDAHYILPSQNQLSPLVRQHNFPLFEHFEGTTNTEYAQFLRRVLTEKLSFSSAFIDASYAETSGHPYLTVNLMVDLCDWLIASKLVEADINLDADVFSAFVQERLTPVALQRSKYYTFFQKMLADYLGERSRKQEPWLHAVATVLQKIGRAHPKAFSCSLVSYQGIASEVSPMARVTPDQLLGAATMSNFLAMNAGHVRPAIRLMGRLAASVMPQVN